MHAMTRIVQGMLAAALLLGPAVVHAADPATYTATIVNIEYQGSKIWVPGTLVVKKGTKVTLNLINNVPVDPKEHGFAIPAYNIAEVVTRGEDKTLEFKADKDGIFPINCQLHPAHVGGQLIVLE